MQFAIKSSIETGGSPGPGWPPDCSLLISDWVKLVTARSEAAKAVGELVGVHLEQHALRGALAGGEALETIPGELALRCVGDRVQVAPVDGHGVQLRATGRRSEDERRTYVGEAIGAGSGRARLCVPAPWLRAG